MFCSGQALMAQDRTITGTVTSSEDGGALPGVNVIIKGSTTGTVTDIEGNYRLNFPPSANSIIFSFIGFESREVEVGTQSVIDIQLTTDITQLGEVVVTAAAIEREKRSLGYAVNTVQGEEVTVARDGNVWNSLAGKVPGLDISSSSGTAGGSARILIRGASTMITDGGTQGPNATNEPLFVVDGVPISNSSYNGSRTDIINGGVDVGNRAGDLNPDDIESITVLKGAAASALYGQRAKNGAIVITTKRGKPGQKAFLTVNSSVRFDEAFKLPDYQNEYAQGDFGVFDSNNFTGGWGPNINEVQGQVFPQFPYDGVDRPLQAYPDNVKDFYQTGNTFINSVSLAGGGQETDFRVGYTNLQQKGITPGNTLDRNTVTVNAGSKFGEKFNARVSFSYIRTEGIGRPRQGSNNPNIISELVQDGFPRTLDVRLLEQNVTDENGIPIGLDGSQTVNNAYWVVQNNPNNNLVDRLFGNVSIGYDATDWLNFTARVGTDLFSEVRRDIIRKGTINRLNGEFDDLELFDREFNSDIMATITKDISPDLQITGIIGHNVNQRSVRRTRVTASDLSVDELYNYANASSTSPQNFQSLRRIYGVYGDVTFNYKNYLFLNLTGRNDWSSTLPEDNKSFFYPSVSASVVFTEAFNLASNFLSFGKFRANWANVGSDEAPYQLDFAFIPQADVFTQFVSNNTFPHGGQLAFAATDVIPPGDALKPQNQVSFEIGTELQFLDGRIGLDATYYHTTTEEQIISVSIPQSTGFESRRINAGEVLNKGFEVLLSGRPVQTASGFNWDIALNFASNKQTVERLAPGLEELSLTSGFSGLSVRAAPGEAFGLYGAGWLRDSVSGKPVINPNTGLREVGPRTRFGDIFPEWTLGIQNTISFKGISLSALIDIREGGVMYSGTVSDMREDGRVAETLLNRGRIFIDDGVLANSDGSFRPNDVPVESMQQFWSHYANASNTEGQIFGASYVKLREIRLSYTLPASLVERTPFGSISAGFEGRNLLLIHSEVPHIDPELNFFGSVLTGSGVEWKSAPTARSFGFNLRLTM
jgi:TonB-linked SusC/RagA family outer membrane protein